MCTSWLTAKNPQKLFRPCSSLQSSNPKSSFENRWSITHPLLPKVNDRLPEPQQTKFPAPQFYTVPFKYTKIACVRSNLEFGPLHLTFPRTQIYFFPPTTFLRVILPRATEINGKYLVTVNRFRISSIRAISRPGRTTKKGKLEVLG